MSNTIAYSILAVVGFLFLSHLSWYGATGVLCPVQYPVLFRCFLGSIIAFFLIIGAIPSGIFYTVIKFLMGVDNFGGTTVLLGLISGGLLMYIFRSSILNASVSAASYTVSQPDVEAERRKAERKVEEVKREVKHQDSQTEMEEALHEMQKAKARVDAFNKD